MNKFFLIGTIAVCIFFVYIHNYKNDTVSNEKYIAYTQDSKDYKVEIIVIDSCEYLREYHMLTHKGNCKFCEERRKAELENLVDTLKENKL